MMKGVISFFRKHIIVSLLSAMSIAFAGGAGTMFALYESRVNRIEDMKVKALTELQSERENTYVLMQRFTSELINDGSVDTEIQNKIAESLVRQYSNYSDYAFHLSEADAADIQSLKTSLNDLRRSVLSVRDVNDLDPVYQDFENVLNRSKSVDSALDRSIKEDQSA